ncbi:hypothetical protein LINPERPRIM_LOCUS39026 [Linum perenne]
MVRLDLATTEGARA